MTNYSIDIETQLFVLVNQPERLNLAIANHSCYRSPLVAISWVFFEYISWVLYRDTLDKDALVHPMPE